MARGVIVGDPVAASDFKRRLIEWRDAGYRIDQVELRQARFIPGIPRHSEFEFAAHPPKNRSISRTPFLKPGNQRGN